MKDLQIIDLSEVRDKKQKNDLLKKSEKIIEDLSMIRYILSLAIDGLSYYNNYVFATECISTLNNNKVLLEIHLNKYKKTVNKIREEIENELEKSGRKDPK